MKNAIPTTSPINKTLIENQNKRVYYALQQGKKLTRYQAFNDFGIGSLPQRIYDLRQSIKESIYTRLVFERNRRGEKVRVKEYSLKPFN